jgi:hypothetical protein
MSSLHNQKMTPPPRVSVVVDSDNRGDSFDEAIGSLLSRDRPADHIAERACQFGSRAVFLQQN